MSAERFTLDTNILVYSVDALAGARHRMAQEVIQLAARCDCRLTLQSVCEFFYAATRKMKMSKEDAADQAQDWIELFPCVAHSSAAVLQAVSTSSGGRAFWDALLVATAAEAGCAAILSEDMADGSIVGGLRVINPFGPDRLTAPAQSVLSEGAR